MPVMQLQASALYANLLRDLRPYQTMKDLANFRKDKANFLLSGRRLSTVRSLMLSDSFMKKFKDGSSERAESVALLKFIERDSDCSRWKLKTESVRDEELIGTLKSVLYDFFNPEGLPLVCSDLQVLEQARTGPGASVGVSGQHVYNKLFSGPMTTSRSVLYTMYKHYISRFPDWHSAEMHRAASCGEAIIMKDTNLGLVPKDRSQGRVICTEKSLDMYYQLGLSSILEDRLKSAWGIDLATQPDKNRELARLGSLCSPLGGEFCTIDLQSASDMPLSMAKSVYPPDFMAYLLRYRSESTFIRGLGSRQLDILSSMGNGFTFPLQTILFAAIVLTSYRMNDIKPRYPYGDTLGNFGVFGDDIITQASACDDVYRILDLLGFIVNRTKSYRIGPFRESCGSDFYNGVNVRGVYCKTLRTPQSRYALINALNEWSARTGIPLQRTVCLLLKSVRWMPVPRWENPDAGIQVPLSFVQRFAATKLGGPFRYRAYRPEKFGWRFVDLGFKGPDHLIKKLSYNPHGLWLTFLQGALDDGFASLRPRDVKYRLRPIVSPCWDFPPSRWLPSLSTYPRSNRIWSSGEETILGKPIDRLTEWARWNTAVYLNSRN